jgi:hypothetical protein
MNFISFDIVFKKKNDIEVFKLSPESEFYQLKLMICGKYKIYDINKLFIYHKGEIINSQDSTKLKEIFKGKKAKIEITDKIIKKKKEKETFKYYCKCKNGATYVCDKCNEFVCEFCYNKKKHITHSNKIIKIEEYSNYIKSILKEYAAELDEKIINDEAFHFFDYWNYDMQNETGNINSCYEYLKNELEDIKQIQIDYISNSTDADKFIGLKEDIEKVIQEYANINTDGDLEQIFYDKKSLVKNSREILTRYTDLKNLLINYTKTIKDIQMFNQLFMKEIKEKFNVMKKKYLNYNPILTLNNSMMNLNYSVNNNINNSLIHTQREFQRSQILNNSQSFFEQDKTLNLNNNHEKNLNSNSQINPNYQSQQLKTNYLNNNSNIINNSIISHEKMIYKIKDERKIIIFSYTTQSFKEKIYTDKGNFKKDMSSESDITQLNLNNKLYILSGKKYNKFYYYDYSSNSIYLINNTLFSHYYGAMVYCNKTDSIYLLGGNNQIKCESLKILNNIKKSEWKIIPSLNEERQEFASMYFNNYIYVFFGFSPKKGINLSSIERININKLDKFEIVYINEQISLSSLACLKYIDDLEDNNNDKEILLLGGFDGTNYIDTSLVLNIKEMKIRDCDVVIPNINTHFQFLFQKESCFVEIEPGVQIVYDMKNNVHLITKNTYELYSETQ